MTRCATAARSETGTTPRSGAKRQPLRDTGGKPDPGETARSAAEGNGIERPSETPPSLSSSSTMGSSLSA